LKALYMKAPNKWWSLYHSIHWPHK